MKVAYILERYPVLSQTFLRREIAGLRAHDVQVEIHTLFSVEWREWFNVPVELARRPALLREGVRWLRKCPPNNWENFWSTVWAALFAFARARRVRTNPPDVLHGVWATGPATAAAILSRLCGVPFSFGAHAYDVYRHGGDAFLTPKLKSAAFVHTTTATTASLLRARCPEARIVIARRGLEELPPVRNGLREAGPLRLLSVGRLVPKKGHALQLTACAELRRRGVPVQARIVGDGPLLTELKSQIVQLGLTGAVELPGEVAPEKMSEQYRWADVLWHTGVVDAEGDRDGLPNVIPEAWAHGLAVVSSDAGGAAEAVAALTVPAGDAPALVAAVEQLSRDAALRQRLGENGRRWVEENFLISRNAEILARAFHDVARQ